MIHIGVIGADRRGAIARRAHNPENGVRLIAGATLYPERLAWMKETYGPDFLLTDDYREVLKAPIDGVFICTPDYLHEEHALAAIEAGKHVYLEKPMAITVEGCDRIIAAAKAKGVSLYLGHNMRFFPVMKKMKELIEEGRIGQVQSIWCRHFISYGGDAYFKDWHSEQRYGHGLLLQKGAHDIDIIHWLAGAYTARVTGMGKLSVYDKLPRRDPSEPQPSVEFNRDNWPPKATGQYSPIIDVEDSSMILMQLANGVQAAYLQSHYTPDDTRNYTIIGTEGRIENYGDHSSQEYTATVHLWNRRTGYQREGHEVFPLEYIEGGHGGSDPQVITGFIDMIRGKTRPADGATPLDARMSVAAGYYGTESLRNGNCPYDIPPCGVV
ncbi:MAG TPA: Gfo/Idh/MocA family oxidoreductase [Chthoniobacteraceae bacterium]|nr:Gfo/Idh/MocA family oxidoreductase [Chthoniobacteraceae bacterium]